MVNSDDQSITATAVGCTRAIGASMGSVKESLRRQFPVALGLLEMSFIGCERLGDRATQSWAGWAALWALPVLLLLVDPAAAQVDCGTGMLKFFGDIETLTVEAVAMLLGVMVISAGALKGLPIRGTDTWGNSAIGGVIVATTFFVLGPALIDLADQATPVDLSRECNAGGG